MNLATAGMVLAFFVQWLRGRKVVPEWATLALTGAIGVGCYWLSSDGNPLTRDFWQHAVGWVLASMGITQTASSLSNLGVAVIPRTNSQ